MKLTEMSAEELASFKAEVQKKYDDFKAQGLSLNMARGKPSAEQLDLTEGLLTAVKSSEDCSSAFGSAPVKQVPPLFPGQSPARAAPRVP